MEELDKLRRQFIQTAAEHGPLALFDAVVTAVDDEAYTCDVLLDDLEVYDVRLRAVVSNNQSVDVLPAVNAQVVIGKMGDDDYILIAADEITSYRIAVGPVLLTITADGTLIGKGTETLNKILNDLVKGLLSVAAPKDVPGITLLKTRIDNLLQ